MGLLSFVKSAGAKLLGKDDEAEIRKETPAAMDDAASAAAREKMRQAKMAARLAQHVKGLGLEVADPTVEVQGETVKLGGRVKKQETREKVVLAVGNHEGIASVDDQLVVENPEPEANFYTVVRGDTLSKIAKEQYGNAMKYPVIFEANKPMLEHPDRIYPGQVLRIPALDE